MSRKEIYLRAYNDIKREWESCLIMIKQYPAAMQLQEKEAELYEKMEDLKILCNRYGYLK